MSTIRISRIVALLILALGTTTHATANLDSIALGTVDGGVFTPAISESSLLCAMHQTHEGSTFEAATVAFQSGEWMLFVEGDNPSGAYLVVYGLETVGTTLWLMTSTTKNQCRAAKAAGCDDCRWEGSSEKGRCSCDSDVDYCNHELVIDAHAMHARLIATIRKCIERESAER